MSKTKSDRIEGWHQTFIEKQKIFFAATAAPEGRVNMAPKDADSLRVMGPNRIVWVNLTVRNAVRKRTSGPGPWHGRN